MKAPALLRRAAVLAVAAASLLMLVLPVLCAVAQLARGRWLLAAAMALVSCIVAAAVAGPTLTACLAAWIRISQEREGGAL